MRKGPGLEFPTLWVFRRAGLPVEIIRETDGWRQVRDADGAQGWVVQSMLSGRRTGLIAPWDAKPGTAPAQIQLKAAERESAADVANVEAGVIANITSCSGQWCRVSVGEIKGYVEQTKLWGVYPKEVVK
jgi:SH3-like domain-containing protein